MITYNLLESGQVSVHCPFCGEDHSPESAVSKNCDHLVSLPMYGKISSLNVSVSTGILLYHIIDQRLG